jgi:large subunit ribosomal protein L7/L12
MSSLGPFMGSFGMGGGGGGGAPAQDQGGAGEGKAEAAAEEAPKEKTHFDIELSKFDPASKIKVIKEIRAIFNLGLKEAKETVEGAPVWLKKEVAKEEAEALAEKLKAVGAEVRLA